MRTLRTAVLLVGLLMVLAIVGLAQASHPTRKSLITASGNRRSPQRLSAARVKQAVRRNASQAVARNISFAVAPQISAGGAPAGLASGDFNGDHVTDLAALVSSSGTGYLSLLLGHGDGTFASPALTPATLDKKTLIYSRDINGDGRDDVILVHPSSFDVFLSTGSSFVLTASYSDQVSNPAAVAIADVDGDAKVDVLIADGITGTVETFLGNGNGTFQSGMTASVPAQFAFALFADVNNDGKLDLVTSTQVFMGSDFASVVPLSGGAAGSCQSPDGNVAVADLNQDGQADIVVAGCSTDDVSIFLSDGNGGFLSGTVVWAGFGPQSVRVSDINGDGHADIVVTNLWPGDISVLLGTGTGSFQPPVTGYAFGGVASEPSVVADFDSDGRADVVASYCGYNGQLTFLKGAGDGTFDAAADYYPPAEMAEYQDYSTSIATADFNSDGVPDVLMGGMFSGTQGANAGITIFLGDAHGALHHGLSYGHGGALSSVAAADFNRDGNLDAVAADFNTGEVNLFLGNGDGTLQDPQIFPAAPGGATAIATGDFNHDGWPDVAVVGWPTGVYTLFNNRQGQFDPAVAYSTSDDAWAVIAGDLNGDGNPDLVIPHYVANTFSVLLGDSAGTFHPMPDFTNGSSNPGGVALRDLNGDGKLDLVFTVMQGAGVALGNGDGTFQSATFYDVSHGSGLSSTGNIALADVNGDSKLDMIFTNSGFGYVDVMPGNGDGSFGTAAEFAVGGMPFDLLVTDLNRDGAPDVVVANLEFAGATTLVNTEGATTTLIASPNSVSYGQAVTLTASVRATRNNAVPSGSITFMDGNTVLGSSTVNQNASATISVSTLAAGTHYLSALYSGDANFVPGASNTVAVVAQANKQATYSLTADPDGETIKSGNSGSFTITASPLNGFKGTIDFSCGPLPAGISCQFSPASIVLSGAKPSISVLTITTTPDAWSARLTAPPTQRPWTPLWAMLTFGIAGCVFIDGFRNCGARWLRNGALAIALLALTGCGGSGSPLSHSQTKTVHVQATAASGISQQLDLVVVVQQ